MSDDHRVSDRDITLASILNVLWRRRLIVLGLPALGLLVGALYGLLGTRRWEATLAIRPGVTAFGPEGGAIREWRLRDITRWYDKKMYAPELQRRLGLPTDSRLVVEAEYAAQNLQDMAGGQVITLWTTATDPELAAAILDTSVAMFEERAEADTIGSQIKLTRDGIKLAIESQRNELAALNGKQKLAELQVAAAKDSLLLLDAKNRRLGIDIRELEREQVHLENRLATLRAEEPILEADLAQIDRGLEQLDPPQVRPLDPAEIPSWAHRDAILDGGSVLEALAQAKHQVRRALMENRARQDSVALASERAGLERERLEITREQVDLVELKNAERAVEERRTRLEDFLPEERRELENQIAANRVKLEQLSPLQRVGTTVTSDEPVRPRPLRAIVILVVLGALAGLVLGFAWDYVEKHRSEIFRS